MVWILRESRSEVGGWVVYTQIPAGGRYECETFCDVDVCRLGPKLMRCEVENIELKSGRRDLARSKILGAGKISGVLFAKFQHQNTGFIA